MTAMTFEPSGGPHLAHGLDLHHLIADHNGEPGCCCGFDPARSIMAPRIRTREEAITAVHRHLKARITDPTPDRIYEDFPELRHRAMDPARDQGQPHPLGLTMDNGTGTTYALDMDLPGGGVMVMPPRDKALATALLELALENVRRSVNP